MNNQDLSYLVGALRDGCFTIDKKQSAYRIRIYQKSKEWLGRIAEILENNFSKKPSFYLDKRRNVWCLALSSKEIISKLMAICEYDFNQSQWFTPSWIKNGNFDIKTAYIRGFFDAEGSIETKNIRIYLAQANKKVLEEIKYLLQEIEIKSNLSGPYIKKGTATEMYALIIYGKERVINFYNKIGSYHPDKIPRFDILLNSERSDIDSTVVSPGSVGP